MALELSDTRTIKITHGTPHPIRADNARIIGMDEMLDRVKSIEYIKLDSSEPIGVIDKMIVTKDKIYILDCYTAQQIFVFDKTGNLLFRIKNKGRGPKEYLSVADMQVDTIRNEILVNDALARSYLYFSADDGAFLHREKRSSKLLFGAYRQFVYKLSNPRTGFQRRRELGDSRFQQRLRPLQRIRPDTSARQQFCSQQFHL